MSVRSPSKIGRPVGPRRPLAYGWIIVAALATILMATSGARFLFGVVLKPVSDEFGWDRGALTGAVFLSMIVLSLFQPVIGLIVDRFGSKRILVGGTLLLAGALIPLSFATQLWQVYLLYGVMTAVGLAATSPVNVTALVSRWFERRRGAALAIATSGSAFSQLLLVPAAAWTLTFTDWQTTYRLLAILLLVVIAPLGWLVLRDSPPVPARNPADPPAQPVTADGVGLREALSTSSFWLLAFGFLVCGITMAFPNIHFIAYADDMGMMATDAASAIAVTAGFSIVGSLALGVLADRRRRASVLAFTYAMRGIAFILLLLLPTGNLLYVYAIVLGISWTATTPLTAAIAADIYGRRNLGIIFGTMFTSMNLGFGIGAVLDGYIYDALGGYEVAIAFNAAIGLLAAIAAVIVSDRRLPARDEAVHSPAGAAPSTSSAD